jgi:hypothetical protein
LARPAWGRVDLPHSAVQRSGDRHAVRMNLPRVLVGVLIRSVVVVVVIAAYATVIARSESTDALGAGLLAFLILVIIAFVWALVDGARHGFTHPFLMWLLTSVVAGIGIPVVLALTLTDRDFALEVREAAAFFVALLLVPAASGLCAGGVVHRFLGRSEVTRPERATAPTG